MSQLFLRTAGSDKNARVYFGRGDSSYSVGANSQGQFSVAVTQSAANSPAGLAANDKDILVVGKDHVAASTIIVRSIQTHQLEINGVPQWQLHSDDIYTPADLGGWANAATVLPCGPLTVVTVPGGGKIEAKKLISKLAPHAQLRITATVHFIDDWQGETAYLKLNGAHVWSDSHELRNGARAINICGSDKFPETKFTTQIDVTVPASAAGEIELAFGTTTDAASLAHFGISSLAVYTRNV